MTEHTYKHDLESIYYCILYLCTIYLGPMNQSISKDDIPIFVKFWSNPENWNLPLLGFFKKSFLARRDYEYIVDSFTDYMRDLGPCLTKLHFTLNEEGKPGVTHENWIKILRETLDSLPETDVYTPPRPGAHPPP